MNIQYRKPTIDDAEELANLILKVWEETYTGLLPDDVIHSGTFEGRVEQWRNRIADSNDRQIVELAVSGDKIAGVITASIDKRDEEIDADSEIYAINILREFHKKGIGQALMKHAFDWLRSQRCRNTYLWVLEANGNAVDFYLRLGGKSFKKGKKFGGDHVALMWVLDS